MLLTVGIHVSDFAFHREKLEWKTERAHKIGESPADGVVEELRGGSESGDFHRADFFGARGEDVKQSWPLEALHDVEVDDVDAILAV